MKKVGRKVFLLLCIVFISFHTKTGLGPGVAAGIRDGETLLGKVREVRVMTTPTDPGRCALAQQGGMDVATILYYYFCRVYL